MPLPEAISIVLGICAGLHHAHERTGPGGRSLRLVHRDVSPSNVLVSYDGAVKLVDFGIAQATTREGMTRHGEVRGKVRYMSPEQCRSLPLDRRSDVFSVGTILYELTTMTRPFDGESHDEIARQVMAARPRPLGFVASYPSALARIVLKALAREPRDRYATARALQLDLEAFAHRAHLALSPVALETRMKELFAAELAAWRRAQGQGKRLIDHLAPETDRPPSQTWTAVPALTLETATVGPAAGDRFPAPGPAGETELATVVVRPLVGVRRASAVIALLAAATFLATFAGLSYRSGAPRSIVVAPAGAAPLAGRPVAPSRDAADPEVPVTLRAPPPLPQAAKAIRRKPRGNRVKPARAEATSRRTSGPPPPAAPAWDTEAMLPPP